MLLLFLAALAGLSAFYLPYRQQEMAARLPPINGITTNIDNPPALVAIVPRHAGVPNPTAMNVRHKSRIGRRDIGLNTGRIRAFISLLNEKLMVEN